MSDDFDEDDWVELERPKKGAILPPIAVRISVTGGQKPKARAHIVLRERFAEWSLKAPHYRVQIGGPNANLIRIIPDMTGGRFDVIEFKGVARLILGQVTAWPMEAREPTEAKGEFRGDYLVLTLPDDFAKPTRPVAIPAMPLKPPPKPAPFPITTAARGLQAQRGVESVSLGDPAPGRSAFDQRKGRA